MKKHKSYGFTVVELIVVVVVIAVLTSITAIAYRSTQADSRDKKRIADVMILKSAIDEYYADKGSYPNPTCSGRGGTYECWSNEAWQLLKDQGYLQKVPTTDLGTPNYVWLWSSNTSYGIYVPLEDSYCKTGKNVQNDWWGSLTTTPMCNF